MLFVVLINGSMVFPTLASVLKYAANEFRCSNPSNSAYPRAFVKQIKLSIGGSCVVIGFGNKLHFVQFRHPSVCCANSQRLLKLFGGVNLFRYRKCEKLVLVSQTRFMKFGKHGTICK